MNTSLNQNSFNKNIQITSTPKKSLNGDTCNLTRSIVKESNDILNVGMIRDYGKTMDNEKSSWNYKVDGDGGLYESIDVVNTVFETPKRSAQPAFGVDHYAKNEKSSSKYGVDGDGRSYGGIDVVNTNFETPKRSMQRAFEVDRYTFPSKKDGSPEIFRYLHCSSYDSGCEDCILDKNINAFNLIIECQDIITKISRRFRSDRLMNILRDRFYEYAKPNFVENTHTRHQLKKKLVGSEAIITFFVNLLKNYSYTDRVANKYYIKFLEKCYKIGFLTHNCKKKMKAR